MGPLQNVRACLVEVLAAHGLALRAFSVMPGASVEGPHEVHVVAVETADGPVPSDEAFDRVVAEANEAEVRRRADETVNEIKKQMKDTGGFL